MKYEMLMVMDLNITVRREDGDGERTQLFLIYLFRVGKRVIDYIL